MVSLLILRQSSTIVDTKADLERAEGGMARRRLGLSEHCTSIPEVFTKAFAELESEAASCSSSKDKRLGAEIWLFWSR